MFVIGPLLVMLVVGLYLWWSHENHEPGPHGEPRMPRDVERWFAAGLLTKDQADAIVVFEERSVAPRRVPLLTEALGYIGAILAIAGGGTAIGQVWEDLGDAWHVAILTVATFVTFGAGLLLRPQNEPAMQRLMGVLWGLSVGAVVWTSSLVFQDVMGLREEALPFTIGGPSCIYAALLWFFHKNALQQAALFGTGMLTAQGVVSVMPGDAPIWIYALVTWAFGLAWFALGWFGWMTPVWTALPLGAVAAMWGPGFAVVDHGWLYAVGLVSSGALMALSITSRRLPLLAIGAIATFIYLISSVIRYFGDTLGVPLALSIVGAFVLAAAVAAGRTRVFGGWHGPAGHTV